MKLFDAHCHLFFFSSDELSRALDNTVAIDTGLNSSTNSKVLWNSKLYRNVFPALGLHPSSASVDELQKVRKQIYDNKDVIVAVGEIGLDYYKYAKSESDKERQKSIFIEMLNIANDIDKPAVVHSRAAEEDILSIVEKYAATTVIMHSYTGSLDLVERFLDLGCYFSLPAIAYTNKVFSRILEKVPIERLLTETDSPFLSPVKGRNVPKNVRYAVAKISEHFGIDIEEAAKIIEKNFKKVFFKI